MVMVVQSPQPQPALLASSHGSEGFKKQSPKMVPSFLKLCVHGDSLTPILL